ncbi:MAG: radical SAM protein [Anaerolineae bacterium]
MIIERSSAMMRRSFEKTIYRFRRIPPADLRGDFGIYVHVPFCLSKCTFCPFYKELFSEQEKAQYLAAIAQEIATTQMRGQAKWIYVGGGTPNLLAIDELAQILEGIRAKVQVESIGIELLPARITEPYLHDLQRIGFTKISLGVESLSRPLMLQTGRKLNQQAQLGTFIETARTLGLWVNVDLMVGLPNQSPDSFLEDIRVMAAMHPSQITTYPFMVIRGLESTPGFPSREQFSLIEKAYLLLQETGYERKSIWTFAQGDDVYDSSRDELIEDYVGFGPAAFSTYGGWKIVNPELCVYLKSLARGERMGFVAPKRADTDDWRVFARRIYDLRGDHFADLPLSIRGFVALLNLTNYIRHGKLTEKGIHLSHVLSKTVVESLPFPVQNPACVENYGDYTAYQS